MRDGFPPFDGPLEQVVEHSPIGTPLTLPGLSFSTDTQVTSNESYVSVLNHCFDDIELFIIRLQHAMTALQGLHQHHLQLADGAPPPSSKHSSKRSSLANGSASSKAPGDLLSGANGASAIGPVEDDFYEIFSKFKLAFNLLAKLKGCIHEPNAPELVHFLFTPLTIIVEAAQNGKSHYSHLMVLRALVRVRDTF